jgi:hypothetical protein
MENTIQNLLAEMWKDYIKMNPDAQSICNLFSENGDDVLNDHIALRTFNHPKVNIDILAKSFIDCGYKYVDSYKFDKKKLKASHFAHDDQSLPKVFISELLIEEFDTIFGDIVNSLVEQASTDFFNDFYLTTRGRPWECSSEIYNTLKEKSEYAAWLAAFGYRPNHFTVDVNKLKNYSSLESVNELVKSSGFKLNESGGEIKGGADDLLAQSSTLAYDYNMEFSDINLNIPSCYYEFALRFKLENGKLFQGFIASSADKIFESTNKSQ